MGGIENCEETNGIYEAKDDDGTSYYYRGTVDNNWVQFGGFYWRIIRINGDGSIRMIYSGDEESGPVEIGEATQIGTSVFNEKYNDNAYVGYMYGTPGSNTYEETHANINDSIIKGVLDNWYQQNLLNYSSYISDVGFCGDKMSTTTDGGAPNDSGGTGTNTTFYGARYRLYTNKAPIFECQNNSDLYTVNSNTGNGTLDYPIGLINADEVVYAGGVYATNNSSYYLYTSTYYWTISPAAYDRDYAHIFDVSLSGQVITSNANNWNGIRPVINLKADIQITGEGTIDSPYEVV